MPLDDTIRTSSESTDDHKKDFRREFGPLIMLVTLVSAINNRGHPIPLDRSKPYQYAVSGSLQIRNDSEMLDAVLPLLVRDDEAVAITAYDPSIQGLGLQFAQSKTSSNLSMLEQRRFYHVWVIQQVNYAATYKHSTGIPATNPDRQDRHSRQENGGDYILFNTGQSHLSSVQIHEWKSLFTIPRKDPLENHIATLEDYLTRYKDLSKDDKKAYFYNFTRYISARSWRKMYRRIFHWSSLDFMQALGRVKEKDLLHAFKEHSSSLPTSKRSDSVLGGLLVGMQQDGQIGTLVMPSGQTLELPHLLAAFSEVVKKKQENKGWEAEEGLGVYSATTCYEFHRLLVAALHAYMDALGAFNIADQKVHLNESGEATWKDGEGKNEITGGQCKEQGRDAHEPTMANINDIGTELAPALSEEEALDGLLKAREKCMERVWKCAYLLWRIASSQILRHNLRVLGKGAWLRIPTKIQETLGAKRFRLSTGLTGRQRKDRAANGGETKHYGVSDEDGDGDGDGDGDREGEGEDEEFYRIREAFIRDDDLILACERWIHLQVSHWTALQTISLWSTSAALPSVKIHLLAVKTTHANDQMDPWENVIRKLAIAAAQPHLGPISTSFDAQFTIDFLKQKINEYATGTGRDSLIFKAFAPKMETPDEYNPEFYGDIHCETALASLMTCIDHGTDPSTEANIRLLEESPPIVAMSNLCCPVCCELLDILRGETNGGFDIRGCHPKVSPVRLPSWLPQRIMSQMVVRFQHILREEIIIMIDRSSNRPHTSQLRVSSD